MRSASSGALEVPEHFNFATDVFDRWATQHPDALALWAVHSTAGSEEKFTFRELKKLSCQAASFFTECGIGRGDRVLIMLSRVPQWWIAMLALTRMGAVPVPATLLSSARDVSYRLEAANIAAVITNEAGTDKVVDFKGIRILAGASKAGWIDFDSGFTKANADFAAEPTRSDEPGILYFTSATTGEPKMVLHTQTSFGLGHRVTGELWLDLKPADVHWNLSDLGWAKAAWSSFYGPWHMGACIFTFEASGNFDPIVTLNTLAHYPITTWCAPPTALRLIVRQDLSRWRFTNLRHCVAAGEPLNPEVLNLWNAGTGLTIYEGYGQTESVVLVGNFRSLGHTVHPGSMGVATPGYDVAVVDESLRPAAVDQEGEVAVRVNGHRPIGLFSGYIQNEAENKAHFQGDWYLTGDRARRDANGYFWFVGRTDDVIKSSGYRIGPFEVESALLEHPAVLEAAVIGQSDPLRGQIVKAYVVLRPGFEPGEEMKTALQTFCKKVAAAYKYPREIEFMKELPKTTSGKTRRVELRRINGTRA
jgi:acetyl-CoA synthetase/medium-chain acyl-CoA synthetase